MCRHFSRVLEDIAINANSEFLMHSHSQVTKRPSLLYPQDDSQDDPQDVDVGDKYEEEDEQEEEEEEIEESALASVQFDTVASVIDFLTNRF